MDPKCKSCVDHCNYEYRGYDEDIKRELDMLCIKPVHRVEKPKPIYITTGGRSGGKDYTFKSLLNSIYGTSLTDAEKMYIENDVKATIDLYNRYYRKENGMILPKIEKVIFNDPATIIKWRDGSKTVVKAENEPFDPEKGLAMAIAKKALGNEGNYYETFKKWLPKENAKTK